MDSNDIAIDELGGGLYPPLAEYDFDEGLFALGSAATDDAVWVAGSPSPVSLAYRRAATLLSIYRSRIDFLDQCKLASSLRAV